MNNQTTLQAPCTLQGTGLHTGAQVTVTLRPAAAGTGLIFRRVDLDPPLQIPATADLVVDTARGTTLGHSGHRIATGEHLLSALHGLQVDNLYIDLDGEEVPILDGSAQPWVQAIQQVGIRTLEAERSPFILREPITMTDALDGVEYIALPSDEFRVTSIIDFRSDVIGKQVAEIQGYSSYTTAIAPCRTFVFLHEILYLLQHNLIKGGALDNALVFVDHPLDADQAQQLARIYGRDIDSLQVRNGVLNTVEPYFPNEPARHKLLDFMGDILLVGRPVQAHFIIKCPGHKHNVQFAQLLRDIVGERSDQTPHYDPSQPPVLTTQDLLGYLPHRYPFLLVDKIIDMGHNYIVGVKNITADEPCFSGHFPGQPLFPGVMLLEALAQVGGLLATYDAPDRQDYLSLLARVDGVRFRRSVIPGDTLLLKVKLQGPVRRGYVRMKGIAYVGDEIVAEATLVQQIVKKNTANS